MKLNKKLGVVIGALAVAGVVGLGVYQSEAAPADSKLAPNDIKQLVGNQYPGDITEFEIEKRSGKVVYEVEVHSDGVEYDLKLDGDTGEVLNEKQEEHFDDDKDDNTKDSMKVDEAKAASKSKDIISSEEAKNIALKEFDGTITDFELDEDDDRLIYEMELRNGNQEAEFDIDAKTGKILDMEIDMDDDDDDDDDDN